MSHLHIPDGVLPWWLIGVGWLTTAVLVTVAVRMASGESSRKRVPLVGAVAALMLVAMSSEIIPIAYHVNLTVLAGILLGPWLSVIAALVVDVMLGLIGHGGVTVIGLNTLIISTEMILGWGLFHLFVRILGRRRVGWSAAGATVLALATSTTLLVLIVALGGSPAATRETGALDPATLSFTNPLAHGVVANSLVAAEQPESSAPLSVKRFAVVVYSLGSIGWVLEALIIGAIVRFIARVRPGLVYEGAQAEQSRAPVGDEGVHH